MLGLIVINTYVGVASVNSLIRGCKERLRALVFSVCVRPCDVCVGALSEAQFSCLVWCADGRVGAC